MASTPDPSVAIILVNWNGYAFTKACLSSLREVNTPDFTVILVDNDSQKPEGEVLKKEFPEILLIQNPNNLGFSGGNNVGIRKALDMGFSHVLLLNNDTEVEPDFLEKMLHAQQSEASIGVIQPMIYFLGEKEKIWSAGGKWISTYARAKTLGDRENVDDYSPSTDKLDWATGCAMLVSREAILAAGLLNEQYFAYFEDVEWSLRIRQKGFEIKLASDATVYHEAGAASKKKGAEGTLSANVFYWNVRNQFLLLRGLNKPSKGLDPLEGSPNEFIAYPYHLGKFLLWMCYFLLRGRFKKLNAVARGIKEGLSDPLKPAPEWP